MRSLQYTIRGVSRQLDAELRREARATGRSLNAVVVEALEHATLTADRVHQDLDWFIGGASSRERDEQDAAQQWLDGLPAELS